MLGRTGVFLSNDPRDFKKGFDGDQPEAGQPRRRALRALVLLDQEEGAATSWRSRSRRPNGEAKVSHKFNAAGFKPNGCSPKTKPLFEEIEALKADAAAKQKEIEAKEKEKEEAEAEAAVAAIKDPGGKEKAGSKATAKEPAKNAAKEPASQGRWPKAAAKEPAKAAPRAARRQGSASQVDLPPAEPEAPKAARRRPNRPSTRSNGRPG